MSDISNTGEETVFEMEKMTVTRGPFTELLREAQRGEFIRLGRHKWHAWWPGQNHDLIFYRETDPGCICVSWSFQTGKETPVLKYEDAVGHYARQNCRFGKLGFFYQNESGELFQVKADGSQTSWGIHGFTDYKVGLNRIVGVVDNTFYVLTEGTKEILDLGKYQHEEWGLDENDEIIFRSGKDFFHLPYFGRAKHIGQYEFDSCRIGICGRFNIVFHREEKFYGIDLSGDLKEVLLGRYEFQYTTCLSDSDWELCNIGLIIRTDEDEELADEPRTEFVLMILFTP